MTIRSPARVAALTALLAMNGCGIFAPSSGPATPGLHVAQAALDSGAGQIALQVSESILRASPKNTSALEIKGDALTLLGQYDDATAVFQQLLARDPNSARANIGLGRIKLSTEPAAAEPLFQQVLKRDPSNLTALNNLGIARDLTGRHAEAQLAYHQALAIDPNLDSAQVNLALSMAMSGQGAAAIQILRPQAAQADASTKVKHDYAVVLAMSGYRAEAERVLADSMAPDDIRQVLDSVTGSHARTVRDLAPDRREVRRVAEAALNTSPPRQPVQTTAAQPAPRPLVAEPMPSVVRPTVTADAEAASVQPESPVALAVASHHPLALTAPIQEAAMAAPVPMATPAPPPLPAQAALPSAPPPSAALPPVPFPPALTPHVAAVKQAAAPAPEAPVVVASLTNAEPTAPAPVAHLDEGALSVQFAATPSQESAHAFWRDLVQRFPGELGQHEPLVIRVERDGMVFWRVRAAGFDTLADAQALCARIHASGQDCFVPHS